MNKTVRYILYAIITAICIISVFIGVYALVFKDMAKTNITTNNTSNDNQTSEPTQDEVKDSFKDLFTNELFASNFDDSKIQKIYQDKPIVYDAITADENKANYYELNIHVPLININSELATSYNTFTQNNFVQYANNIKNSNQMGNYTIYNVNFTSYINNDILSLVIMATLKIGNNPQRILVKTYNYDLTTNEEVSITKILDNRGIDSTVVNKKINSVIQEAKDQEEAMSESGYEIYKRDLQSDEYDVTNVKTFFQGPNGELYIVYAYGNTKDTSEMDVIII